MHDAVAESVVTIWLPTPYLSGPVNCYLVEGDVPTLVDTGPPTEDAWAALVRSLEGMPELAQVVITHAHPDHFGLYERLRSRFGCRVLAPEAAARWLQPGAAEEWGKFLLGFLAWAGVPADALRYLKKEGLGLADYKVSEPPDGWIAEGVQLKMGDDDWRVLATPGHSSCSAALWRPRDGLLLGGDSVLLDTYSYSLLEPDLPFSGASRGATPVSNDQAASGGQRWYRHQVEQIGVLKRLRELPLSVILPGHGEPILAPGYFLSSRLRYLRGRQDAVRGLLQEGEKSLYQVCMGLFPHLGWNELLSGLSETVGYLDLLEERGEARAEQVGNKLYYRAL